MYNFWKKIKKNRKSTAASLNFPQKILITPLDWGLGHTTRCISIIRYLQQKSCQIFIAGNAQQTALLRQELHDVTFLYLKGYNIRYARNHRFFTWKILAQAPSLMFAIFRENLWLRRMYVKYHFDIVISDNRYGMFHSKPHTIIITHQLQVRSGFSKNIDEFLNARILKWINRFNECWVPDIAAPFSLAGSLSHPKILPGNVKFIGPLTRLKKQSAVTDIYLLVILSGPEPQRTIFERLVLDQVKNLKGEVLILRGLPDAEDSLPSFNNVSVINHMPAKQFEEVLSSAQMVLCRAGYSSVMDLVSLEKKAILVATPGQAEQEYLSQHLLENKIFYCVDQEHLDLKKHLAEASLFEFRTLSLPFAGYQEAVDNVLLSAGS